MRERIAFPTDVMEVLRVGKYLIWGILRKKTSHIYGGHIHITIQHKFINNNHNFIYDDRTRNISKFVMEMEKNNKTFFLVFLDYE